MSDTQRLAVYKSTVGSAAPIRVKLDTGDYNVTVHDAASQIEVWISTNVDADFIIEQSRDGENWRTFDTITVSGAAGGATFRDGFLNAYRYVRVRTTTSGEHEVEIVGTN